MAYKLNASNESCYPNTSVLIIKNCIKCKKCNDVIVSTHRNDFKFCLCGACAVDGGTDYLRRCGNREDWEELSETEKYRG